MGEGVGDEARETGAGRVTSWSGAEWGGGCGGWESRGLAWREAFVPSLSSSSLVPCGHTGPALQLLLGFQENLKF